MVKHTTILIALMAGLAPALGGGSSAIGAEAKLPEAVATAIREAFPDATVQHVGREREGGVMLYEVSLTQKGVRSEVEVTLEGVIVEVESVVRSEDLPTEMAEAVKALAVKGMARLVEKHETRAVCRGGRFIPLEEPRVVYEARLTLGGRRGSFILFADHTGTRLRLPPKAEAAIRRRFPKAVIKTTDLNGHEEAPLYEVALEERGTTTVVKLFPEGTILEVAKPASEEDLPAKAAEALRNKAGEAATTRVRRVELLGAIRDGKVFVFPRSRFAYEAEVAQQEDTRLIRVDGEGTLLKDAWRDDEEEVEEAAEEEDNPYNEDDEDEDEDQDEEWGE